MPWPAPIASCLHISAPSDGNNVYGVSTAGGRGARRERSDVPAVRAPTGIDHDERFASQ
jgi:hypothetical protein